MHILYSKGVAVLFVVFTVSERKKSRRRWFFKKNPAYEIERKEIGNTYFYILKALSYNGKINWKTVLKAIPNTPGNIVTDQSITFANTAKIKPYDTSNFLKILYYNLFCYSLRHCNPSQQNVAVVDMQGRLCNQALSLLKRSATVYVVTANQNRYLDINQTAAELYGAELIIVDDIAPVMNCTAILAPFGVEGYGELQHHPFLFAPKFGFEFCSEDIFLPPHLEKVRPIGVDKLEFAAALYEKCRIDILLNLVPSYIRRDGARIPVKTAVEMLAGAKSSQAINL